MAKKTETRPATGHINPFGLRMQPDLRERLEAAAAAEGRSLNAEIVARLEASFEMAQNVEKLERSSATLERSQKQFLDSMKTFQAKLDEVLSKLPPELQQRFDDSLLGKPRNR